MNAQPPKLSRGRPKVLDRARTLNTAIQIYWEAGLDGVSLNEVCRQANVSKPALYREFGKEDGFTEAVLREYADKVLTIIKLTLASGKPFYETLSDLANHATIATNDDSQPTPKGCLIVNMRESYPRLGEATQKYTDHIHGVIIEIYKSWVECAKAKGEFTADMSSEFAAIYIDSQLSYAKSQLSRGEQAESVSKVLNTALSVLSP